MATISDPENAIQRLHVIMRDNDKKDDDGNPIDQGLMRDLGGQILKVSDLCREYVDNTGKAFKGSVTATFEIHASPDGKMVQVEIGMKPLGIKVPPTTMPRRARFWIGPDGELSTTPIQKEQMTFPALQLVEGGKQDNAAKPAAKVV